MLKNIIIVNARSTVRGIRTTKTPINILIARKTFTILKSVILGASQTKIRVFMATGTV